MSVHAVTTISVSIQTLNQTDHTEFSSCNPIPGTPCNLSPKLPFIVCSPLVQMQTTFRFVNLFNKQIYKQRMFLSLALQFPNKYCLLKA